MNFFFRLHIRERKIWSCVLPFPTFPMILAKINNASPYLMPFSALYPRVINFNRLTKPDQQKLISFKYIKAKKNNNKTLRLPKKYSDSNTNFKNSKIMSCVLPHKYSNTCFWQCIECACNISKWLYFYSRWLSVQTRF